MSDAGMSRCLQTFGHIRPDVHVSVGAAQCGAACLDFIAIYTHSVPEFNVWFAKAVIHLSISECLSTICDIIWLGCYWNQL